MGVCAAIKPDGVRCRARAMEGYASCYNQIEKLKNLSGSIELNPEMLKEYEAAFKKMWNQVIGPNYNARSPNTGAKN